MTTILGKQLKGLRRVRYSQILNFCIYFCCQVAAFGFCLGASWFVCQSLYNSEFFYRVVGNGFLAAAIFLLGLIFLVTPTFSIAASLVTRKWTEKFKFLNERVVGELNGLQLQFLELQRYEDTPQQVLFFNWNSSDTFATLEKYEVLKTSEPNSWNLELFGRVIARFDLEKEIQKQSLEEISKLKIDQTKRPAASDLRDSIPLNNSLRSRAVGLASKRKNEKDKAQAAEHKFQELVKTQQSKHQMVRLFDALDSFKDKLKVFPNVVEDRISRDILNAANDGHSFPYKFNLRESTENDEVISAVTKHLGSSVSLSQWFQQTKTLPSNFNRIETVQLNDLNYLEGSAQWAAHSTQSSGKLCLAKLLRGWVTETLLASRSAQRLANFAKKNEIKITISFVLSGDDDYLSSIFYKVNEPTERGVGNDLDFDVTYHSNNIYY